jgi:hypothetical protein|tara:strand:+ start:456 stop:668 length:213 start_codon:yes stop_codon:yes gene_type:complete
MFYDNVDKLNEIEKTVCENLMTAAVTANTSERELLKIAHNYRSDMANMIGVLREYKELISKLEEGVSDGT